MNEPIDPRLAVVYFDLSVEIYNLEDGAKENDDYALKIMREIQARGIGWMEDDAVERLGRLFGRKIDNEGHDQHDSLVCRMHVDTVDDVREVLNVLNHYHAGGNDSIEAGDYVEASNFRFYPQGVNGPSYGANARSGDIEEWLITQEAV